MNKRLPIFLGFFLSSLAVWVLITSNTFIRTTMERLEHLGYDLQLKTYILRKAPKPSPAIAIVDIDDRSLEIEGRWPWQRNKIATLVDQLHKQGAVVIAFDMFFSEQEPNLIDQILKKVDITQPQNISVADFLKSQAPLFDYDKIFADSLSSANAVLAISFLKRNKLKIHFLHRFSN